jgi:hypothetical protein
MRTSILIVFMAVFCATPASSNSIDVGFAGFGFSELVKTHVRGASQDPDRDGPVGEIYLAFPDGSQSIFYCLSPTTAMGDSESVNIITLSDVNTPGPLPLSGALVAWLLNRYAPGVNTGYAGAGLQIAIWEVLHDTTFDLTTGIFIADASVLRLTNQDIIDAFGSDYHYEIIKSDAENYLDALTNEMMINPGAVYSNRAVWLDATGTGQDFGAFGTFGTPIPELGSFVLLGTGCAAMIGLLARRTKHNNAKHLAKP